jgi:selenocysteine-specific elongation factor
MHTIGGGTILDPNPVKHKLLNQIVIDSLLLKEKGNPCEIVEHIIAQKSSNYPKREDIIKFSGKGIHDIGSLLSSLIDNNRVIRLLSGDEEIYIHNNYYENLKIKSMELLDKFHKSYPLKAGISKEEFKNKIFGQSIKQKIFDELIELLKKDTICLNSSLIWSKNFIIKFDKRQAEIKENIINTFIECKYQPPKVDEIIKSYGREEKAARMVFDSLVDMGMLVKIDEDIYFTRDNVENAKILLMSFISSNNEITAAQFRDLIGASRKYAVALLEYFDSIKLTRRLEDKRVLAS